MSKKTTTTKRKQNTNKKQCKQFQSQGPHQMLLQVLTLLVSAPLRIHGVYGVLCGWGAFPVSDTPGLQTTLDTTLLQPCLASSRSFSHRGV
jgi:hypothetical protein